MPLENVVRCEESSRRIVEAASRSAQESLRALGASVSACRCALAPPILPQAVERPDARCSDAASKTASPALSSAICESNGERVVESSRFSSREVAR